MDGAANPITEVGAQTIGSTGQCPACWSPYTVWMQKVRGQRTNKFYDQWICLDCRTAFNPTGYKEDDLQLRADADFFEAELAETGRAQAQLCLEILTRAPCLHSACEIGSGSGRMLQSLKDYGVKAEGFELNPHAADIADRYGLVTHRMLLPDGPRQYDLMVAIGVFEHVPSPSDLMAQMVKRLNPDGYIYLNVPFFEREHWRCLFHASDDSAPPNVFCDNDVHITHFSIEGLMSLGRRHGARSADYWVSKDVVNNSPGSYPGVLFRF